MRTLLKEVEGIDWMDAAVMNCKWKGPRLRDILNAAGVRSIVKPAKGVKSGLHVAFSCYAVQCQNDDWFGGSIDLDTCLSLDAEVILALEVSFYVLCDAQLLFCSCYFLLLPFGTYVDWVGIDER